MALEETEEVCEDDKTQGIGEARRMGIHPKVKGEDTFGSAQVDDKPR